MKILFAAAGLLAFSGCVSPAMRACNSGDLGSCRVACIDNNERACHIACAEGDSLSCFDYAQARQQDMAAGRALLGLGAMQLTPEQNRYGIAGY